MKNLLITMCMFLFALVTSSASADQVGRGLLRPGETGQAIVVLPADEPMIFTLYGDGDGDIDCAVFDEYGNRGDVDTRVLDECRLDVVAIRAGVFRYVFTNVGSVSSYYTWRLY